MEVSPAMRREFANQTIEKMVDYAIETFALPQNFKRDMKTRFNVNSSRGRSHAGYSRSKEGNKIVVRPYIYLFMGGHRFNSEEPKKFLEYNAIANDPEIGSVENVNWSVALATLIAHEVAHMIVEFNKSTEVGSIDVPLNYEAKLESRANSVFNRGHGAKWQYVYRILRRKFINKNLLGTFEGTEEVKKVVEVRESLPKRTRKQRFVTKRISSNFVAYFKNEDDTNPIGWIKTNPARYGGGYVPILWDGCRRNILLRVETLREAREALGLYD